ncbi:serine proteinase stubble-like [Amphibalanus amphitrite]|uniref:serine proteinase stubble-like n=1 Tax=Amphibalanus amphitrite TaxID=1232801 RepID=UPI001C918166|nr:serine proteinase stubble-like [Amphibalanus amphitrite]
MRTLQLIVAVCVTLTAGRAATVSRPHGRTALTNDAVVIEGGAEEAVRAAHPTGDLLERHQEEQTVVPPGWPGLPAGVSSSCRTDDGRLGRCVVRTVCYWSRSLPAGSHPRPTACRTAGDGARRPLLRGVCCPGLFSEITQTTSTSTSRPASTQRVSTSTSRPATTQWWQTTYQSAATTTTTAITTTRPRPSVPTIPPMITHPWQGSSSTTAAATSTAWWQSSAGPTESTTATTTTTTRRGPTTTAWWQTTTTSTTTTTTTATTSTSSSSSSSSSSTAASGGGGGGGGGAAAVAGTGPFGQCGRSSHQAGSDQDRIVGGVEARQAEFPWIAGIFKGKRQFCGGSLIDETHILTAAHCVAHMTSYDVRRLVVRLGDHDIQRDDEADHDEYGVARIIRHKGFSDQTLHTDIALLTLSKKVTFRENIRPICLVSDEAVHYAGDNVTVAGWGSLSEAGRQPSVLQKVTLQVWENSQCASSYGKSAPGGIISSMLCAAAAGKDSCSGDSGGPLMHVTNGVVYQVGVVSWGIGCAKPEYPGVYTRVASLRSWIERNREAY